MTRQRGEKLKKEKRTQARRFNQNIEQLIQQYQTEKKQIFQQKYARKKKRRLGLGEFNYNDPHLPKQLERKPLYPNSIQPIAEDFYSVQQEGYPKDLSGPISLSVNSTDFSCEAAYPQELPSLHVPHDQSDDNPLPHFYHSHYPKNLKTFLPKADEPSQEEISGLSFTGLLEAVTQLPIKTVRYLLANLLQDSSQKDEEVQILRERIAQLESQMFRINHQFYTSPPPFSTTSNGFPNQNHFSMSHREMSSPELMPPPPPPAADIPPPPPPPPPPMDLFSMEDQGMKFKNSLKKCKAAAQNKPSQSRNSSNPVPRVTVDMLQGIQLKKISPTPSNSSGAAAHFASPRSTRMSTMNGQPIISLDQICAVKLRATPKQKRSPIRMKSFNGRPIIGPDDLSSVQLRQTPKSVFSTHRGSPSRRSSPLHKSPSRISQCIFSKTPSKASQNIFSQTPSKAINIFTQGLQSPRVSFKPELTQMEASPQPNINKRVPNTAPAKTKNSRKNFSHNLDHENILNSPNHTQKVASTKRNRRKAKKSEIVENC